MELSALKAITEANRLAWNDVTPYHQNVKQGIYFKLFETPGYSCLDKLVTAELLRIGLKNKSVVQFGSNDGRELLSLKNLGAASCIGFDISDAATAEAKKLAAHSQLDCQFIQADVLDIDETYNSCFDLVYISAETLGWIPDLGTYFEIAARVMRSGGILVIYEQHPFLEMLQIGGTPEPLHIIRSYFSSSPTIDYSIKDNSQPEHSQGKPYYWFSHSLSQILNGVIKSGLKIQSFDEFPHDISGIFRHIEQQPTKVPMSYILISLKS